MVISKTENMSKTTSVCITSPRTGREEKPKFRTEVCKTTPQKTCTRTTEFKPSRSKYCCTCNGKEWDKKVINFTGKIQTIPMKKKVPPPKVLTKKEYDEYQELRAITKPQEQEVALKLKEEKRQRLVKESMERKREFMEMDKNRPREKSPTLIEIEEEARKRTNYILERAENMKIEQEEEIQKCNRIILETKCRAIRDAQIAEKKLIEQELEEEEKRLNDMLENERRWAIKEEFRKEQEETAKKEKFANSLIDQIKDNEEHRMLEFEKKQEESRLINLSNIAWQQEVITKLRNKEAENARVRQELAEGNEQLKHLKAMEEQENKIIDLRIQQYQRYKEEREAKLAEERKLQKLKQEQTKAKVATQALAAQDFQKRIDELNAARIQEQVEREWRQKEKEEAIRRAEIQKGLAEEREKQINNKRIMQAIELERERREFEKIVRVQKEAFCREQKEIEKKQRQALVHRSEILKQVNEKERERIKVRQKMFEEGLAIRTETEIRKKKLRETMERKCDEMRNNKVPEMYINDVKRLIDNLK